MELNTTEWFNWIEYDLDPFVILNPWNLLDPIQMLSHFVDYDIRVFRMVFTMIVAAGGAVYYNQVFTDPYYYGYERHGFLALFGFTLGIYNYGISFLRTLLTIILVFFNLHFLGGTKVSVVLTVILSVGHLFCGYYLTYGLGHEYSFDWTIPHSVLTLKLIGVAFDLYDGINQLRAKRKSRKTRSGHKTDTDFIQNPNAIEKPPTLFQLLSHSYFPGSFLVGPQLNIKHTIDFCEDSMEEDLLDKTRVPGLNKIYLGFAYGIFHAIGSYLLPSSYLLSPEFSERHLMFRVVIFVLIMKIQFYKYFFFFLVAEGICILYGINYDPDLKDSRDFINYKICANCDPIMFDLTGSSMLNSFDKGHNLTTNRWVAKYIFYRLPQTPSWINRNWIRTFICSICMALWHGFYAGYLNTFILISIIYSTEWDFHGTFSPKIRPFVNRRFTGSLVFMTLRLYSTFLLPYIYCSMFYLTSDKFMKVYSDIYYLGHLIFIFYWSFRLVLFYKVT